ncbi:unnamed protein product [Durusdinium trenchii]|uniref:CRAL-TRIO domain-containing protein n=1 Tax=Durusdinium trenchii TaxID=1381693 RepID=A0ABP0Q156_9DINO
MHCAGHFLEKGALDWFLRQWKRDFPYASDCILAEVFKCKNAFTKKYPAAAKQITSRRELEALSKLAGNGMAMRAILVAITVALRAMNPVLAQKSIETSSPAFAIHLTNQKLLFLSGDAKLGEGVDPMQGIQQTIPTGVRDWASIAPDHVTFKNCFKIRKQEEGKDITPVPHDFTFLARQDMPSGGEGIPKSERVPRALRDPSQTSRDIFSLVKQRMSSTALCQDPLLCMPGSLSSIAEQFVSDASKNSSPKLTWQLESERRQELSLISKGIERDFPHLRRAVAWYGTMLEESPVAGTVPDLSFLRNAPAISPNLHEFELGVISAGNFGDYVMNAWPTKLDMVEEAHQRSWEVVTKFVETNLVTFQGKSAEAESTVLPNCRSWIRSASSEVGTAPFDHSIVLMLNGPTVGVFSATQKSFFLNFVANVIADHPQNAIAFVVHPNRAGHRDMRLMGLLSFLYSIFFQPVAVKCGRAMLCNFDGIIKSDCQEAEKGGGCVGGEVNEG